jgi:hypothetical protein
MLIFEDEPVQSKKPPFDSLNKDDQKALDLPLRTGIG